MPNPTIQPCPLSEAKAIEVLVVGDDENPLANMCVAFRAGSKLHFDKTNADGTCRFDGIPPGLNVELGLFDLDGEAWELLNSLPLRAEAAKSAEPAVFEQLAPPDQDGPATHEVKASECLLSIGYERGFLPETIWAHGPNQDLWGQHQSKAVLSPGLLVHIPKRQRQWVGAQPGHLHVIHRIGIPVVMSIRVLDAAGRPMSAASYILKLVRSNSEPVAHRPGITDGAGFLHAAVMPDVVSGTLLLSTPHGVRNWTVHLDIGALRPANDPLGAQDRLKNLGYRATAQEGVWPMAEPLHVFQRDCKQQAGGLDEPSARTLTQLHLG